jgi:hypothetical protein
MIKIKKDQAIIFEIGKRRRKKGQPMTNHTINSNMHCSTGKKT